MRPQTPLLVSAAMNAILLAMLAGLWYSKGDRLPSVSSAHPHPASRQSSATANEVLAVFNRARDAGMSEDLAYGLALRAAVLQTLTPAVYAYWKSQPTRITAQHESAQKSDAAARELLLQSFGAAAKDQPAFESLFKPYNTRFSFLSSDKQIALQKILFESESVGAPIVMTAMQCPAGTCDPTTQRIREILTDDEFAEYQMRESQLALRLAGGAFDFSEEEFRVVYEVLASNAASNDSGPQSLRPSADIPADSARAIKEVLGKERFATFQRAQDPIFRLLSDGARRYGVAPQKLDAAYEIIKTSQREADAIKFKPDAPLSDQQARIKIYAARDAQLESQLGPQLFAFIAPRLGPRSQFSAGPASLADAFMRLRDRQ